jgi:hypothetical protein
MKIAKIRGNGRMGEKCHLLFLAVSRARACVWCPQAGGVLCVVCGVCGVVTTRHSPLSPQSVHRQTGRSGRTYKNNCSQ